MKNFDHRLIAIAFSFIFSVLLINDIYAQQDNEFTDAILVKLKRVVSVTLDEDGKLIGTGNGAVDEVINAYEIKDIKQLRTGKRKKQSLYRVQFNPGTNLNEIIDKLMKTGEVEFAEPDFKGKGGGVQSFVPNDPLFNRQWGLYNDGSFTLSTALAGADIDMINAWLYEQGDSTIVVSVLDSGTRLDHPEFAGRIWINNEETPGNGTDDDMNGFTDDFRGWDFVNNDNNPTDDHGHGTNVMGIVGVNSDNSLGFAGVDFHCKLMAIKVLNNQNVGDYSWFTEGVYYSVDNGADVINLSLGGSNPSQAFGQAIQYALDAGVVVVACMMNANNSTTFYPAGYPGVIAVGATNPNDTRANPFFWSASSGSCYGTHISVSAPGNFIYGLSHTSNTNYNSYWGGTSQAAPLVAGLSALLLAQDESRTPAFIKQIIEETSIDQVGNPLEDIAGFDIYHGHGRINAHRALTYGVTKNSSESDFHSWHVFPNPTNGTFRIVPPIEAQTIELMAMNGSFIKRVDLTSNSPIDIQIEATGVYVIKVIGRSYVQSKKLIVN